MTDLFTEFFTEVHGYGPYPWQQRLFEQVVAEGRWPDTLDLPTGTGKTAALDIAVVALAMSASQPPAKRRHPRRIILVVDRRVVVDQASIRARAIARALAQAAPGSACAKVADRLRIVSGTDTPLVAAMLRGAVLRDDRWWRSPAQALVAASTVDQIGSRLLFRGYGVRNLAAPIHAGLLGNDCLLLLDEVHLSRPFSDTLSAIGERFRGGALSLPWQVVSMSATQPEDEGAPKAAFQLDDDDRAVSALAQRLGASKPATLVLAKKSREPDVAFIAACADAALAQAQPGRAVGVVVNRVHVARAIHRRLEREPVDAVLLTGRMRPVERDARVRALMPRLDSRRARGGEERPLIVVATQCIEAGADLDFDALVTECASVDALTQRFGRLNRAGSAPHPTPGVIVGRAEQMSAKADPDPVYGEALAATWAWLKELDANEGVDFGIDAFRPPADARFRSPAPRAPVLLPAHLDAWVQTSQRPEVQPDPAAWLHGEGRPPRDVHVVWRADLTDDLLLRDPKRAIRQLIAFPPSHAEAITLPIHVARAWLAGEAEAPAADVEGETAPAEEESSRRKNAPAEPLAARPWVVFAGDKSRVEQETKAIRVGDVIVVPATTGGLAAGGFDPASPEEVSDLGDALQLLHRGRAALRLHPDVVHPSLPPVPRPDRDPQLTRERVVEWLDAAQTVGGSPAWLQAALRHLGRAARGPRSLLAVTAWENGDGPNWVSLTSPLRLAAEDIHGLVLIWNDLSNHYTLSLPLMVVFVEVPARRTTTAASTTNHSDIRGLRPVARSAEHT